MASAVTAIPICHHNTTVTRANNRSYKMPQLNDVLPPRNVRAAVESHNHNDFRLAMDDKL